MNMIRLSVVALLVLAAPVNAGPRKNQLLLEQLHQELNLATQKQNKHEDMFRVRGKEGRIGGGDGAMSHRTWAQQCAIRVAQLTKQIERLG